MQGSYTPTFWCSTLLPDRSSCREAVLGSKCRRYCGLRARSLPEHNGHEDAKRCVAPLLPFIRAIMENLQEILSMAPSQLAEGLSLQGYCNHPLRQCASSQCIMYVSLQPDDRSSSGHMLQVSEAPLPGAVGRSSPHPGAQPQRSADGAAWGVGGSQ